MLSSLIFVMVPGDRRTTSIDLEVKNAEPAQRAQGLLAENLRCDEIELRRVECLSAVVARVPSDLSV